MSNERLEKQMRFLLEIDREKLIERQTYLSDRSRKENDAEHAWHLAMMALLLSEYANGSVDVLHVMTMVLTHDLVEIYAGDTFAYDDTGKESQREREVEAAQKLFSLLPEDQGEKLRAIWEEFEARETAEAKFARTLDNFQPTMLNRAAKGVSWMEHGIHVDQVLKRNERSAEGSETLWNYAWENFIEPSVKDGYLKSGDTE